MYKLAHVIIACFENEYMPSLYASTNFGIQPSMVIGRFQTLLHQYNYNLFLFI